MFWNVLLLEMDKIFKRAIFWIELAVLAAIIIIIDSVEYIISQVSGPAGQSLIATFTWPRGLESVSQFAGAHSLGGLLLVILLSAVTAQEYSWRTYHLWLGRGVSRLTLLAAKCVVALIATLLVVVTAVIVGSITTGILTLVIKGSLPFQQVNFGYFFSNILIIYYSLLPYVALAFLLSILSRSVALSISVGLVFILLVEGTVYTVLSLLNKTAANIVQYLPIGLEATLQNATQTTSTTQTATIAVFPYPPVWVAIVCIALYVLVFVGLAFWRFVGQNFTD
jgi:ABC-type transport system involved in multi-copper enzyme maturation permease subunit